MCFSDVNQKPLTIPPNMCALGIMMEQEVTIRSLQVQFLSWCTQSVGFHLDFVQEFFTEETSLFSVFYCGAP